MGCLYQTFKLVIIMLTLVNIGTGYTKFYQLLVDVVDKIGKVRDISSTEDLIWIPFLTVQVSSTIFQFIQLYCLFRELCENNFMYKHCFKCCFILTFLIYLISVLPKSILTIIYYNYSSSIPKWWKSVANFFDGLLSGVTALGFQIVLFMPVILRTCRSAGMCRRKVQPTDAKSKNSDYNLDTNIEKENSNCCLFPCCVSTKYNGNDNSDFTLAEKRTSKSRVNNINSIIKKTMNKGIKMKSAVENGKKQMEAKVTQFKEKRVEKIKQKAESGTRRIKAKVVKQQHKMEEEINDDYDADEDKTVDSNKNDGRKHGSALKCLTASKSKVCVCLGNRTQCFIISMTLANLHLFVYVVEVVFIFCLVC